MTDTARRLAILFGLVTALAFVNLAVETTANFEAAHGLTTLVALLLLAAILAGFAYGLFQITKPNPPTQRARRLDNLEQRGELASLQYEWQAETDERNRNDPR